MALPTDAMAQLFAAAPANDLPRVPNYNLCPTDAVHIVTSGGAPDGQGARRLGAMRWGFIPSWYKTPGDGPLLINARAETIAQKPAFRDAARQRRGLIVASGFYEWTRDAEGGRHPWYITHTDGSPLAMAAVWQDWRAPGQHETTRSCAVVTCAATGPMQQIHHRMPVLIAQGDWPLWLGEAGRGAATLMRPAPNHALRWHRVDRAVNANHAEGPELIEPI